MLIISGNKERRRAVLHVCGINIQLPHEWVTEKPKFFYVLPSVKRAKTNQVNLFIGDTRCGLEKYWAWTIKFGLHTYRVVLMKQF